MRIEGKNSFRWFCIFLYLPSALLFFLSGSRNLSDYITTSFFIIIGVAALAVLGSDTVKSDERYYKNLNTKNLLWAVLLGAGMILLSTGLSLQLENFNMLLSINRSFLSLEPMSLISNHSSVSTMFISTILYGLVMAATSEELFKLGMFAEGRARWRNGYRIGKATLFAIIFSILLLVMGVTLSVLQIFSAFNMVIVAVLSGVSLALLIWRGVNHVDVAIPGVLLYVGFPVAFWSALHGIQAYDNPVMILPAAINGIVLFVYLWKFECILGCIFAHWIYNSGITLVTYILGKANIPSGTAFLPNIFDRMYYSNSGFIFDGLILILLILFVFAFLAPSLSERKR